MSVMDLPRVADCTASSCAHNHGGCHAGAVTISHDDGDCATFPTGTTGGLPTVMATVGACQRTECAFNEQAACTASEVHIGSGTDTAQCLTYSA